MTLRQKVEDLLSQWHGEDASVQLERRDQLVSDLVSLIREARRNTKVSHPKVEEARPAA